VSEEQAAERRRAEREARKRAQEEATAYNDELGAAVVKSLSRLRVDERVIKILTAVDLHGELDKIALRGARYGFPGWVVHTETRPARQSSSTWPAARCRPRRAATCRAPRALAEHAGRCVALCVMALCAREEAMANSTTGPSTRCR